MDLRPDTSLNKRGGKVLILRLQNTHCFNFLKVKRIFTFSKKIPKRLLHLYSPMGHIVNANLTIRLPGVSKTVGFSSLQSAVDRANGNYDVPSSSSPANNNHTACKRLCHSCRPFTSEFTQRLIGHSTEVLTQPRRVYCGRRVKPLLVRQRLHRPRRWRPSANDSLQYTLPRSSLETDVIGHKSTDTAWYESTSGTWVGLTKPAPKVRQSDGSCRSNCV